MPRASTYLPISMIGAAAVLLVVADHGARGETAVPATLQVAAAPPAFATCKACHSVVKGGPNGVGPNLFGVVGAAAGTRPGYAYSPAMKAANIRWARARLDAYLEDPKAVVPGTKMMLPGIRDAAKRDEIISYLEKLK